MKIIIGFLIVMAVLVVLPAADFAFAAGDEPGEYLDRRVVIWNLFYKLMTVAFYCWSCSFRYNDLAMLEI
jgi:hypothetical protein